MMAKHSRRFVLQALAGAAVVAIAGCREKKVEYGYEIRQTLDSKRGQVWAVAPAIDLSGQPDVDPILQADIVFQQMQTVRGLTAIPVNRVAEVYATLHLQKVQSADQAALVCDLLGCDALIVPTITAFDPYNPPKLGASLQMFRKPAGYARSEQVDPRALSRAATPEVSESLPTAPAFTQAVGMFDAADGSVREALFRYAEGRNDPLGPMREKEYLVSMDRFCGFVYYRLIGDLLDKERSKRET